MCLTSVSSECQSKYSPLQSDDSRKFVLFDSTTFSRSRKVRESPDGILRANPDQTCVPAYPAERLLRVGYQTGMLARPSVLLPLSSPQREHQGHLLALSLILEPAPAILSRLHIRKILPATKRKLVEEIDRETL